MHAKALTAIGGEALSPMGTASASPQPDAFYVQWLAGAKKTAGEMGPFDQTQSRYEPILTVLITTGSNISQERAWIALTSADLSQTDGTGSLATRYIGLRYSTAAGDTDWELASGDGTTGSVIDTGIAVQPNTSYLVELDWSGGTQLVCLINGIACATKTTNLDIGNATDLGIECATTSLGTLPTVQDIAYIGLIYNGNDF
jgi:hypothetical protein